MEDERVTLVQVRSRAEGDEESAGEEVSGSLKVVRGRVTHCDPLVLGPLLAICMRGFSSAALAQLSRDTNGKDPSASEAELRVLHHDSISSRLSRTASRYAQSRPQTCRRR